MRITIVKNFKTALLLGALAASSACTASLENKSEGRVKFADTVNTVSSPASNFVIASWNTEHLAYPITQGCRPRNHSELAKLQSYARSLNADIVALQEVASIDAVRQLFPENKWQVVISERPGSEGYTCRENGFSSTQQKVAFAVRKGIPIKQSKSVRELGLASTGLRYGLELTVESPMGAMTLLNVHMKSGCFVDNYSQSELGACQIFAKQAPILDAWIEQQERSKTPYVVLGDFNHRLSAPYNHLTRQLTTNSDNTKASLENTTAHLVGCHPYYPAPIDHILLGNMAAPNISKKSTMHPFDDMAPDEMLSDHCALSLELSKLSLPISNAVKWQTTSKEYRYLTSAIYRQAEQALKTRQLPVEPWVVVMDVDETVLDNSQYQVAIEQAGLTYSRETWNAWVASEQATPVPGAKSFIETIFQQGGKLALITNRSRELDVHTWNNLRALGVPVSVENTCLMGRIKADIKAINGTTIKNDKDLRRQQIQRGQASCFHPETTRTRTSLALKIIMQVGDNIEDFTTTTQEKVDIEALLPRSQSELILLPNPMYGSW
mgnify:CR=1 FL=1